MNILEPRHQKFFSKFQTFTLRMSLTQGAEFTLNITVGVHKFTEHGNVSRIKQLRKDTQNTLHSAFRMKRISFNNNFCSTFSVRQKCSHIKHTNKCVNVLYLLSVVFVVLDVRSLHSPPYLRQGCKGYKCLPVKM